MTALLHDVRHGWRALISRPAFAAVSILTLGVAIGTTAAVFSVVDTLLMRPAPYQQPDEIFDVIAEPAQPTPNVTVRRGFAPDAISALRERTDLFQAVESASQTSRTFTGGDTPVIVPLMQVSEGLLPMLGVRPRFGRLFTADDFRGANGQVIVIGDRLWREQLGGDPTVVGRTVDLDDTPYTIVGVMPREFSFPREIIRGWIPMPVPTAGAPRGTATVTVRLRRGLTPEQAARDVRASGTALVERRLLPSGFVPALQRPPTVNRSERTPLIVLLAAVGLVLAVACVNVMSLALAQATGRQRQLAVCSALGASRGRLLRQLLIEKLLLSAAGGAAGAGLAYLAVDRLAPAIPTSLTFLSPHAIRVDDRVLLFTAMVTVASAIVAGVWPSLRASRLDVVEALRSSTQSAGVSPMTRRTLWGASIGQCALAVVLLVGAALLIRSFLALQAVDPGFDARNLLVLQTQLPRYRYPDAVSQLAMTDRVAAEFERVPGVVATTVSGGAPPSGGAISFGYFETDSGTLVTTDFEVPHMPIAPDYFDVMGIPLLAGATFTPGQAPHDVIVNDVFATRYWGSIGNAVGRRFRLGPKEPWYSIVGVSRDVKMMGLDDRLGDGLEFYYPWPQGGGGWGVYYFTARTAATRPDLVEALRDRFRAVDSRAPILQSSDIRTHLETSIARHRFFSTLLALFAGIAALVAAIGIYALFAYVVAQRRHEVGVRLALGATGSHVMRLIMRDGLTIALAGALIGVGGALLVTRVLTTLLFNVQPTDPIALAAGAATLVLLAAIACYVPARRAQRTDPVTTLKVE